MIVVSEGYRRSIVNCAEPGIVLEEPLPRLPCSIMPTVATAPFSRAKLSSNTSILAVAKNASALSAIGVEPA